MGNVLDLMKGKARYFQLEPTPPLMVRNHGLFVSTVQDAALKYPEFRRYFHVILDFGVVGRHGVLDDIKASPPLIHFGDATKSPTTPSSVAEAESIKAHSSSAMPHNPHPSNMGGDASVLKGGLAGYFANIHYLLKPGGLYAVKVDHDSVGVAEGLQLERHMMAAFFGPESSTGFEKINSFEGFSYGDEVDGNGARVYFFRKRGGSAESNKFIAPS